MKMANDSGPDREIRCLWKHYSMKPRQDVWKPCKRGELTSPLMILRCATRLNIYRWTTTFTLYHNNLLPIDLHERRLRELWVNVISIIEFLILWLAIDSGMAAIKYSDLQNNRYVVTVLNQYVSRARILQKSFIGSLTNYTFSYDRMLDMKVNIFFFVHLRSQDIDAYFVLSREIRQCIYYIHTPEFHQFYLVQKTRWDQTISKNVGRLSQEHQHYGSGSQKVWCRWKCIVVLLQVFVIFVFEFPGIHCRL